MTTVYLNGALLPVEEATVSVLDRGFIFGDGVYEVIPVYDRRPFRLAEHLERLQSSLDAIRLPNPHTRVEWQALLRQVMNAAEWADQGIYLQVTRGPAPRDHAFPRGVRPTVFVMPMALSGPTPETVEQGVAAVTAVDNRWQRCDIKTTSLLPNVLLRQLAADQGCAETILIRDGLLTEGSTSSVFLVRDGVLLAPPKSAQMLPGVTYDVVLELAAGQSLPHAVQPVTEDELRNAAEIWLTSSTKEVTPVTRLDGRLVADGRPGPVYRRMFAAYQEYKRRVMRGGG